MRKSSPDADARRAAGRKEEEMDRAFAVLAGAGLGAGLMYLFDPQLGRRRRAIARDKAVRLAHEAQDAAEVVTRDMRNRAQGLASGDLSVLIGGKRVLEHPLRGSWSPSARAVMAMAGGGLFLYGLTQDAPAACVLGTVGLALAVEGVTNAGLDDIGRIKQQVADKARDVAAKAADTASHVAGTFGYGREGEEDRGGQRDPARQGRAAEPAPAMRG